MDILERVREMAENELNDMTNNGKLKSRDDVHTMYELVDIVKDIDCMQGQWDEGYSNSRYPMANQYSRANGRGSMRGYSRNNARQDFIEEMRRMAENAPDDQSYQASMRFINELEGGMR